jgi:hypothetical protein
LKLLCGQLWKSWRRSMRMSGGRAGRFENAEQSYRAAAGTSTVISIGMGVPSHVPGVKFQC